MSFTLDLTDEHVALRDKAHTFSREVIRPVAAEYDRAQELPWPVLQEAARQGLYQWELYAQLSMDPTGLSLPILMEELFWGCAGIGLTIVLPALALAAIRQAATDEQLVQWAPQCFGTPDEIKLAALAVTEPSGGSDVRSIQTRARQDGSDWIIDGHKVFIGNGGIADVHVVVATVDPDAGHRGQGVFIVPKHTPGLSMLRKLDKLGCRASHTAEILLENCRVPGEHLLGGTDRLQERIARGREAERGQKPVTPAEEGGPAAAVQRRTSAALGAFERTRPMVAAQAIGIARAALEFARDYAVGREAFGQPIIENQGISFPLATSAMELHAAYTMGIDTARRLDRGEQLRREVSMMKAYSTEMAVRAIDHAVQVHGAMGFTNELHLSEAWQQMRRTCVADGSSEIMRTQIVKALRSGGVQF